MPAFRFTLTPYLPLRHWRPFLYRRVDLIAHASKYGKLLLLRPRRRRRVVEGHERARERARPDARARVVRVVADDQDVPHRRFAEKLFQFFRLLRADVDANFFHRAHGQRVHLRLRVGPRARGGEAIAFEFANESLGHLAARRVAGAQHEDHGFLVHRLCSVQKASSRAGRKTRRAKTISIRPGNNRRIHRADTPGSTGRMTWKRSWTHLMMETRALDEHHAMHTSTTLSGV